MYRTILTDAQWRRIEPMLPAARNRIGRPYSQPHRTTIEAILWVARTGSPWRDLPEAFGKWGTIYQRFRRWVASGVFGLIFKELEPEHDLRVIMVDGTFCKVHQHAAGARRNGLTPEESRRQQAIGRTKGGLNTKVVAITDLNGRFARFGLSPGQAHEAPAFDALFRSIAPEQVTQVVGDRAFDSRTIRDGLLNRRATPIIPPRLAPKARVLWWSSFRLSSIASPMLTTIAVPRL